MLLKGGLPETCCEKMRKYFSPITDCTEVLTRNIMGTTEGISGTGSGGTGHGGAFGGAPKRKVF